MGSLLGDSVTHHIIQNADLLRGISVGKSSFRHNDFFRCLWEDRFVVLGQDYRAGKQHPILSSEITGIVNYPARDRQAYFLINHLVFYRL